VSNGDTTAPTVSVTAPAAGATVSGAAVSVTANASDNVGVVGVQFKLDGANLGAETRPHPIRWPGHDDCNQRSHSLTAVARDAGGNTTTSTAVAVTVSNGAGDTTAPTVSITAPAGGATVSAERLRHSERKRQRWRVGVQFKLDGANLGAEDTSAPYSASWNTTAATNGSHALTAVARDAPATSPQRQAVTVTVSNAGTAGPAQLYPGDVGIENDANSSSSRSSTRP